VTQNITIETYIPTCLKQNWSISVFKPRFLLVSLWLLQKGGTLGRRILIPVTWAIGPGLLGDYLGVQTKAGSSQGSLRGLFWNIIHPPQLSISSYILFYYKERTRQLIIKDLFSYFSISLNFSVCVIYLCVWLLFSRTRTSLACLHPLIDKRSFTSV
jgi:hypothetical protein